MASISAVIIVKNEEAQIRACLERLRWTEEIVVLDSQSTDRTLEICHEFTERVFQHTFVNFPRKRNAAIALARYDWILMVDADERVSRELEREIRARIEEEEGLVGYWVPRQNLILGRWIRHAGWWPDYQLRLFRRGSAHFDEHFLGHEVMQVNGPTGRLRTPLLHYNYQHFGQLLAKQKLYTPLQARSLLLRGVRLKPQNFLLQPLREFKRRYWDWAGYREGGLGLVLSLVMAWYNFVMHVQLLGMEIACERRPPERELAPGALHHHRKLER